MSKEERSSRTSCIVTFPRIAVRILKIPCALSFSTSCALDKSPIHKPGITSSIVDSTQGDEPKAGNECVTRSRLFTSSFKFATSGNDNKYHITVYEVVQCYNREINATVPKMRICLLYFYVDIFTKRGSVMFYKGPSTHLCWKKKNKHTISHFFQANSNNMNLPSGFGRPYIK